MCSSSNYGNASNRGFYIKVCTEELILLTYCISEVLIVVINLTVFCLDVLPTIDLVRVLLQFGLETVR